MPRQLGSRKIDKNVVDFLLSEAGVMSVMKLSEITKVNKKAIYNLFRRNGKSSNTRAPKTTQYVKKQLNRKPSGSIREKIPPVIPDSPKVFVRPPATYSNSPSPYGISTEMRKL